MKLIEYLLRLIYPERCIFCGELLEINKKGSICDTCKNKKQLYYKSCAVCGTELENHYNTLCHECMERTGAFSDGISIYNYADARDAILSFKYKGLKNKGTVLGELMADFLKEQASPLLSADIIAPVPISQERFKERGFNQTEILARQIEKRTGIKCIPDLLIRTKNTKPQNSLNELERHMNVYKAFKVNEKYNISGKTIIIIDDIYTTGSTITECGRVLKQAGANCLFYFTLARTTYKD